jgi:hypothetical protein
MSAGYVTQPATNSSAYRPVRFTFRTAATLDLQEKAEVEVQLGDGTPVAKFMVDYKTRVPDSTNFRYNFEVDIQSIAQSLTIPLVDVMHPGARCAYQGTVIVEPKSSVDLKIVVQFYKREFGSTNPVSGTITSNTITCWPIMTQTNENQELGARYISSGARQALVRSYFNPEIPIRLNENYSLCIVQPAGAAHIEWSQRAKSGTVTSGTINFVAGAFNSANDNKKIVCINVGPRGLLLLNLGVPVITSETDTYNVRIRNASNQNLSSLLLFKMVCQKVGTDIRLCWMNDRGGFDYHSFSLSRRQSVVTTSDNAAIPLTWESQAPAVPGNKSRFKVNTFRDDILELESDVLERDQARWVSFVLSSPEVYLDQVTTDIISPNLGVAGVYPVIVEDSETLLYDSEEVTGVVIRLRIRLSNPLMVQQI